MSEHLFNGQASLAEAAPEATSEAMRVPCNELADGPVEGAYAVQDRELRRKRSGEDFLQLTLGDRTGKVRAISWDDAAELAPLCTAGAVVWIRGEYKTDERWGATVTLRELRPLAEDQYDSAEFVAVSEVPFERLEADLRDLLATIQNQQLRELLDRFFGETSDVWQRFRVAPAAKFYHQAYTHGLLEHTLTVAQAVSAAASTFPGIDRDVAVAGALLHDIGKTQAYNDDPIAIDLTDAGRLQGEIPLGYYAVRRQIESIDGFDPELGQAIVHIVLSHHGSLEHGSPVVPATREATLVHMIDNLGGRLGSFDRIERELADGESWSRFDRGLDSAAYFRGRRAA